jgi:hypothetical protein
VLRQHHLADFAGAIASWKAGWNEEDLTLAITVCASWNRFNQMIEGHGIDKKWNEELFRARGASEKMADRYIDYEKENISASMATRQCRGSRRCRRRDEEMLLSVGDKQCGTSTINKKMVNVLVVEATLRG